MAVVQSTYNADAAVGFAGMVADQSLSNRISRSIEDAAGIGFGRAAFRGTLDHSITGTPSAAFLGFTIAHYAPSTDMATGAMSDKYPRYSDVPVMVQGVLWVVAGAAVQDGQPVYVTPAGVITNVDGSGANFAATGWVFDTSAASGALARIAKR